LPQWEQVALVDVDPLGLDPVGLSLV